MIKLICSLFLVVAIMEAASIRDIESKISSNKKAYKSVNQKKSTIDRNLSQLADKINTEEKAYKEIVKVLDTTNTKLFLNKVKLSNAKTKIEELQKKSNELKTYKDDTEKGVVDFAIENYALSMGIEQTKQSSLDDVIGKEVYTLIFDNVKSEIMDLNIQYLKINKNIRDNEKKITELNSYIKEQNRIKEKYKNLVGLHQKTLGSLKSKHNSYQKNLQEIINKQNKIQDLLGSLNILKKEEIKKEQQRKKKLAQLAKKKKLAEAKRAKRLAALKNKSFNEKSAKKEPKPKATKDLALQRKDLDDDIDIEVRKLGSSVKGIKISKYYGKKTIAPLKSYSVTKKFGKYYDKVYKMQLFNESVSLKTKKPNAKVYSIFKGQVVYAKQNSGLLENVVIVKHQNSLHTIYSHLERIAPTLKVGKWIPKGYVVGRVNDTLEFQATKNSRYIDPLKLIK